MRLQLKIIGLLLFFPSANCLAETDKCLNYSQILELNNVKSLNILFKDLTINNYNNVKYQINIENPSYSEIKNIIDLADQNNAKCSARLVGEKSYQILLTIFDDIFIETRNNRIIYFNKKTSINNKDISDNLKKLLFINKKGELIQRSYYDCFNPDNPKKCENHKEYSEYPFYNKNGSFAK